jgi:acyl-CoA synthetase (NDP forming)
MLEYAKTRGIGFSKVFSLGNKADINENDVLSILENDASTKVIPMYIEDLSNGREFIKIASRITGELEDRDRKPILAIKVGESTIGAKAIASHTCALAGSQEAYNAIFAQSGVLKVGTLEELFDYAVAFAYQPIPSSEGNTAIVSNAGGVATIVADIAARYNLKLATFSNETTNELRRILPKTASLNNPVDIIGDADHLRYENTLRVILKDQNVNSCLIISTPQMMLDMKSLADVIIKIKQEFMQKTLVCCLMAVTEMEDVLQKLDENNIPQYSFPESATKSIVAMQAYRRWITRTRTNVRTFKITDKVRADIRTLFAKVKSQGRNYIHETEAMQVLSAYGIHIPQTRMSTINEDECIMLSEKIGYPVVLKIVSPDIIH